MSIRLLKRTGKDSKAIMANSLSYDVDRHQLKDGVEFLMSSYPRWTYPHCQDRAIELLQSAGLTVQNELLKTNNQKMRYQIAKSSNVHGKISEKSLMLMTTLMSDIDNMNRDEQVNFARKFLEIVQPEVTV